VVVTLKTFTGSAPMPPLGDVNSSVGVPLLTE